MLVMEPAHAGAIVASTEVIAGHRLESLSIKNPDAKLCVVFENGLRGTLDTWSNVIAPLANLASVFAYNRPGYGNSQATQTPRDGITIVEELRLTLQQKGQSPPSILVGHSLGGLYMQLFARSHPDEVRGLVDLIYQTGEQLESLGAIDDKPIIQLINKPTGATAIAVDFGVVNHDPQAQAYVRQMYPKASKMMLDSDHQMQQQSPAEVVAAIQQVIAATATE